MILRFWPRSLAARTAFVLLVGLILVQGAGLAIHAMDRIDFQRLAEARSLAFRIVGIYRTVELTAPAMLPGRATIAAAAHCALPAGPWSRHVAVCSTRTASRSR